jgi:DNA-binding transcriptional regulator YiaG
MSATNKRRNAGRAKSARKARGTPLGRRLVSNMEKLVGAMAAGGLPAVEKQFTVRRVRLGSFTTPALSAADVTAIRKSLGASQAVFAALIGANVATVRAWEQGVNPPSGVAAKFLAEIRADPAYWKSRIAAAAGC